MLSSRLLPRPSLYGRRLFSRVHHAEEKQRVDLSFNLLKPLNPGQETSSSEGPLVILHGLFGSKRNWSSLCKAFHRDLPGRAVYSLDLRNHGSSPHARPMTYQTMAEDVRHFLETHGLNNVSLLGHSMGAKVAMSIALSLAEKNPKDETISRLIVADMAPVKAELSIRLSQYISAMQDVNAMPAGMIKSLPDADRILAHFEQNPAVRQFLLTNLLLPSHSRTSHTHEKAKFALPLSILQDALPDLAEFPYDHKEATHPTFDRPTLVISGTHSEYRILDHTKAFKTFFPRAKLESLDAGHWVHAERPNEFKKLVVDFIKST